MAKITAAEVNKLRKMTGAGMMDCKKALVESDGDFDAAIDILRKKGQKVANKRADKEANEGIVIADTSDDQKYGAVIKLSCETDSVAKNTDFIAFAKKVLDTIISNKAETIEAVKALAFDKGTLEEAITEMVGKTGEKMELVDFGCIRAEVVSAYNHMGNKLATVLGLNKATAVEDAGHQLAMQVAAMAPVAVDKDDVSQEVIDKEVEIGKDLAIQEGKPEELAEKIALGKLNKFFKDNTLVNQAFVRDSKITVGQFLKNIDKDLKVVGFKRLMLGE